MYSTKSLLYHKKYRTHEFNKQYKRQKRILHMREIIYFISNHVEALFIGLAGTSVIPNSETLARKMITDSTFTAMHRSNIFLGAIRNIGYALLLVVKFFLDGASKVLGDVYKLFSFYNSSEVNAYINNLIGFLWIPCVISILILGYQLIFNSQNRPDTNKILQNFLIITIIVTGLPAILSSVASMTKTFVTSDINSIDKTLSNKIISEHLTDYTYLYDWDTQSFIQKSDKNIFTHTGAYDRVTSIDINDQMEYWDTAANPDYFNGNNTAKWDENAFMSLLPNGQPYYASFTSQDSVDSVCWLATIVTTNKDGSYQCEHINELQWYDIFSDGYYYRYDIDYFPCLITLLTMAIAIIFSSIKIARILWELAIYRVLAMFFSLGDLHNGEKLKEIIKAIGGAFIVIIVNAVLLQFYLIFSAWLTAQNDIGSLTRVILLITVAIAVVDGPNLIQKLIGVDAGIRSAAATIGAMYAGGKIISGVSKTAVKAGKQVGEFGSDVAHKGAAVGGFAAGVGTNAARTVMNNVNNPGMPKDERRTARNQAKTDRKNELNSQCMVQSASARNAAIQEAVVESAPNNMRTVPGYNSDSIDTYTNAAQPIYAGRTKEEYIDMGQDAYLSTHGDQLVNEAAEIQDEGAAGGVEISDKDAITSAFANKHSAPNSVTSDSTYEGANQSARNKIDKLTQSQADKGSTVTAARLENYEKLVQNSRQFSNSDDYKDKQEVHSHIAAAAQAHKRMYDPSAPDNVEGIDKYQGNMSAALAHKSEIMSNAKKYIEEQKAAGNKNVSMDKAITHVVSHESEYDMSYGFDVSYADDISKTLIASENVPTKPEEQRAQPSGSQETPSSRRNMNSNNNLNRNLSREKNRHDQPTMRESAKSGYQAGRNFTNLDNSPIVRAYRRSRGRDERKNNQE